MTGPVKESLFQVAFFIQNQCASTTSTLVLTLQVILMQDPSVAVRSVSLSEKVSTQDNSVVVRAHKWKSGHSSNFNENVVRSKQYYYIGDTNKILPFIIARNTNHSNILANIVLCYWSLISVKKRVYIIVCTSQYITNFWNVFSLFNPNELCNIVVLPFFQCFFLVLRLLET